MTILLHSSYSRLSRELVATIVPADNVEIIDWWGESESARRVIDNYLSYGAYPAKFPVLFDRTSGVVIQQATSLQDLTDAIAAKLAKVPAPSPLKDIKVTDLSTAEQTNLLEQVAIKLGLANDKGEIV